METYLKSKYSEYLMSFVTFSPSYILKVVGELWRPAGGAYNVDKVLGVMVSGLEEELNARINGSKVYSSRELSPSLPKDGEDIQAALYNTNSPTALSMKQSLQKQQPKREHLSLKHIRKRFSWGLARN